MRNLLVIAENADDALRVVNPRDHVHEAAPCMAHRARQVVREVEVCDVALALLLALLNAACGRTAGAERRIENAGRRFDFVRRVHGHCQDSRRDISHRLPLWRRSKLSADRLRLVFEIGECLHIRRAPFLFVSLELPLGADEWRLRAQCDFLCRRGHPVVVHH